MKSRILIFSLLALFVLGVVGCGGGGGDKKIDEAKQIINEMLAIQNKFIESADSAKNVDDAVVAISDFSDGMAKMFPKIKEMEEKYPELKNEKDVPAELKDLIKKSEGTAKKLGEAMTKISTKYASDKKFQEAMKKLTGALMQN